MVEDLQVATPPGRKVGGRDAALQCTALPALFYNNRIATTLGCCTALCSFVLQQQQRATSVLLPLQRDCKLNVASTWSSAGGQWWVRVTASGLHFTTAKHTLASCASDPVVGIVKLPISMALFSMCWIFHVLFHGIRFQRRKAWVHRRIYRSFSWATLLLQLGLNYKMWPPWFLCRLAML